VAQDDTRGFGGLKVDVENFAFSFLRARVKVLNYMRTFQILKSLDWRVKVILIIQGIYNFSYSFVSPYNVLFAHALGATGTDIGLMLALSALVMAISSPMVGLAIERFSIKKIIVFGITCDIVALTVFALATDWWVLIPAFVLYYQLIRQMPLADLLIVTFTELNIRGTVMGLSRILWGGAIVLGPLMAATLVNYYGELRPLYYIAIPITISALIMAHLGLSDFLISGDRKVLSSPKKRGDIFFEYKSFLKEGHIGKWIVIRFFKDGQLYLLMTFIPLWVVGVKGAAPTTWGALSSISSLSAMLAQVPAGNLSDKIGRKKAFFLFTSFYCLGIITLISSPSTELLFLAAILGMGMGGIGGAAFTPFITLWWEAVPAESRGKLYGLEGIVSAPSRIPFMLIGGALWDWGFKAHVLVLPVIVEVLIVIPILSTIPEKR